MSFWKPGAVEPGIHKLDAKGTKIDRIAINENRKKFPIYKSRLQILYLLENYPVLIISADSDSGKSCQIPQYLMESGWTEQGHQIVVTEPNDQECITLATKVSTDSDTTLGGKIGYAINHNSNTHKYNTSVKFVGEEILLREILVDPLLSTYSCVIIDNAHLRTVNTDILLGILKKILKKRLDLRVIINTNLSSEAELIHDYFQSNKKEGEKDTSIILSIESKNFPVREYYMDEPCADYIQAAVETVFKIHESEPAGDILVFLTGREEIDTVVSLIDDQGVRGMKKISAYALHGGLSMEERSIALEPANHRTRKVIVATNIAESSLVIDGVVYVIDCGFAKNYIFDPSTSSNAYSKLPISQSSANQRKAKAGKTKPGKCFRLFTEQTYNMLHPVNVPEMQRTNLTSVILLLKAIGIENVLHFDYISPPSSDLMSHAFDLLYSLKALDDNGKLTFPFGQALADIPLNPLLGAMLLNSRDYHCTDECLTIAAMISAENIFIYSYDNKSLIEEARKKHAVVEGDLVTYVNVYQSFLQARKSSKWCQTNFINYNAMLRAVSTRGLLLQHMKRYTSDIKSCGNDLDILRKCIVSSFFSRTAKLNHDGSYSTVKDDKKMYIHPNSVLSKRAPEWVVYTELVQTSKLFITDVTVIEPRWLIEMAPSYYQMKGMRAAF